MYLICEFQCANLSYMRLEWVFACIIIYLVSRIKHHHWIEPNGVFTFKNSQRYLSDSECYDMNDHRPLLFPFVTHSDLQDVGLLSPFSDAILLLSEWVCGFQNPRLYKKHQGWQPTHWKCNPNQYNNGCSQTFVSSSGFARLFVTLHDNLTLGGIDWTRVKTSETVGTQSDTHKNPNFTHTYPVSSPVSLSESR